VDKEKYIEDYGIN
jgi:hypothetical protein